VRSLLRPARQLSAGAKSGIEVAEEILRVFDPNREPQQIGRSGAVWTFDRGAVLDPALDAAEGRRPLPDLDPSRRDNRLSGAPPPRTRILNMPP